MDIPLIYLRCVGLAELRQPLAVSIRSLLRNEVCACRAPTRDPRRSDDQQVTIVVVPSRDNDSSAANFSSFASLSVSAVAEAVRCWHLIHASTWHLQVFPVVVSAARLRDSGERAPWHHKATLFLSPSAGKHHTTSHFHSRISSVFGLHHSPSLTVSHSTQSSVVSQRVFFFAMLASILFVSAALFSTAWSCPRHDNYQSHPHLGRRQVRIDTGREPKDWNYDVSADWATIRPGMFPTILLAPIVRC
jgi:hypothetical protein